MYNFIKRFLPKKFLIKNETYLRKVIYLFYVGNNHLCSVCNKKSKKFILNQRGEKLCPNCGSMPRDRRLFDLLINNAELDREIKMLDFSPSRSLYRQFSNKTNIHYYPSDLSDNFLAKYHYDITKIDKEDAYFDLIICYHILEHIVNDSKAMDELYRVLKPKGKIYIQTPFKDGDIYEDFSITTPEERLIHFGQDDHVRIYSIDGLIQRLEKTGLQVERLTFEEDTYKGLNLGETVLIASK